MGFLSSFRFVLVAIILMNRSELAGLAASQQFLVVVSWCARCQTLKDSNKQPNFSGWLSLMLLT
jgi:hypothetical protein